MSARALLLLSLLAAPAFAQGKSEEEAGDVSELDKDRTGPLKDRVSPVSGHLFMMRGRFEASIEGAFTFRDSFYQKVIPGLFLAFHFTETLGASLRAGYAIPLVSSAAQICTSAMGQRSCRSPTLNELDMGLGTTRPFGRMGLIVDLNLEWAPLYGKLGMLAIIPFLEMLHFNIYASAGPALILAAPGAVPIGANVNLGFRFFTPYKWLCVRLELRDVIYYEQFGPSQSSVRNQLMGDLGISVFLPVDFNRE
jgi:outer membrane beta-barrel protein